jgi:NAD(P)-dependent dehydrogenase (short-subunit alcohol dehydrogenase family)
MAQLSSIPFSMAGRTALVTGSTRGIGAAIARKLASAGAEVIISGRSILQGKSVAERIRDAGGCTRFVRCDVRDPDDVAALVETTVDRFDGIDILVNNAAIETDTAPQEVDVATWDDVVETNFRAYWLTAKHAYTSLAASDHAAVVNVSSNHAFLTHPGKFPYNALKAGINGMTRALSVDWGVDGIRVNAVAPGWTAVERIEAEVDEAERRYLERIHPLGRLGTPDDVALATLFLASDMASFVTGETLLVDGGRSQIMQDDVYLREALDWPGYEMFDEWRG